jgi:hypothetical protein
MAMKSIAVCALAAAFSLTTATAKTVTNPPRDANEQSVNGVAGPPPHKKVASATPSAQPSKKALKKSKITPPPPLHDPN